MSMKSYGATMAAGIVDEAFGAYTVDNVNYHYYIVKWTEKPFMVVEDEELKFGEGEDSVLAFKGDWACHGVWLEELLSVKNWWTMTNRSCIVRM